MGQWNREGLRNIVSAGSMLGSWRGLKYLGTAVSMVPSSHGACTAGGLGIGGGRSEGEAPSC
jgi:hypothetical protein